MSETRCFFTSIAERDVLLERKRQMDVEGWTPEHDDLHGSGEMAKAAVAYAMHAAGIRAPTQYPWPWDYSWWKPRDPRRNLVRAAALLIAEIERLDRALPGRDECICDLNPDLCFVHQS